MNNLIISIISIALVVILAGVGIFYGGDVFKDQQVEGAVAKYMNESSQIQSAITMFESDGNEISQTFTVHQLVDDKYLKQLPEGWGDQFVDSSAVVGVIIPESKSDFDELVCYEMNEKAGFSFLSTDIDIKPLSKDTTKGIPYCSKEMSKEVPCCVFNG